MGSAGPGGSLQLGSLHGLELRYSGLERAQAAWTDKSNHLQAHIRILINKSQGYSGQVRKASEIRVRKESLLLSPPQGWTWRLLVDWMTTRDVRKTRSALAPPVLTLRPPGASHHFLLGQCFSLLADVTGIFFPAKLISPYNANKALGIDMVKFSSKPGLSPGVILFRPCFCWLRNKISRYALIWVPHFNSPCLISILSQ